MEVVFKVLMEKKRGTQVAPELINTNLSFTSHAGDAGAGPQVQLLHEMMGPLNFETQTEGAPPTLVFNLSGIAWSQLISSYTASTISGGQEGNSKSIGASSPIVFQSLVSRCAKY